MKKVEVDRDLLYHYYVEENHNIEETANLMNLKYRTVQRAIKEFDFNKDKSTIQKQRVTNLKEKYGVENVYQLDKSKDKCKQTKLERYGDENFNNSEKQKQTMLDKYGITKNILYDLYIIKNMRRTEVADKLNVSDNILKTALRYFNIHKDRKLSALLSKETNLEKYGVECNLRLPEIIDKRNKTSIEKYGSVSPFKDADIYNKRNKTMIEKYGVQYTMQTEYGKSKLNWHSDKQKATMLKRYGVDNGFKLTDKIKETKKIKYNKETYNNKAKQRETMIKKYGDSIHQEKAKETNLEKYGVEYACLTDNCINSNGHTISKINKEISKLLEDNNIHNEFEYRIKNKSYDLHILNTNILIEINPSYTHNSTVGARFSKFEKEPLAKDYHFNKTILARDNNYRCIHIWDWDDIDKIVAMLKPKERLFARKLVCKEVSLKDTNEFLNNYHLQNTCKGQIIRLGLYTKEDELVQVMTFGKPRFNNKFEYELLRLCTKSDYIIVGGAKKLFTHFINQYKPESIISYCDNSKFNGNVYTDLGFNLKDLGNPTKHWFNGETHITDNLLRQRGFDQLFNTNYGKGTSNIQLMLNNGFIEIYDCGQSVYIWNNK